MVNKEMHGLGATEDLKLFLGISSNE